EASVPEKLKPVGTGVVLAQVAKPEIHLDGAQKTVVIVSLLLEPRLDAVGEKEGVDLIGTVICRGKLGPIVLVEIGLVKGDHHQCARWQVRARTREAQAAEEPLKPSGRL